LRNMRSFVPRIDRERLSIEAFNDLDRVYKRKNTEKVDCL